MSSSERSARTAALCLLVTAACKLQEVTIPLGREVLVVQGVMTLDPAAGSQYVVVERSLTGTMQIPDQDSLRGYLRPPLPVSGASVVVFRDDGDSVRFYEIPDTAGVYAYRRRPVLLPPGPFFLAGREYRLRVTTPDGRQVTGRTRIPAMPDVTGLPSDGATFNRDHDTLRIGWSGAAGTKGIFAQVRPHDLRQRLTFLFFTDSTQFRIPGKLPLPFLRDTLPPVVFVAGTRATVTVAAMDTNFYDFFRTGSDPFTGTGFINTLQGGLGVFGSMAPVNRNYEIRADQDQPIEGRYEVSAVLGDPREVDRRSFTAEFDLYVNRDLPPVLINALGRVTQGFFSGGLKLEAWGRLEEGPGGSRSLHLWVLDAEGTNQPRILLLGGFSETGTAGGVVKEQDGRQVGTYTITRIQ